MGKLIVVAATICVLAALAVPKIIQLRNKDMANRCVSNLRDIEAAKAEWVLANHAKSNDVVTMKDIAIYFPEGIPKCPSGGTYAIGKVGEPPTCSLGTTVNPPHVLP